MNERRIGLIGVGRLGGSLARALSERGLTPVAVAGRGPERARALADATGSAATSAAEVVERADLVFLAVPDDVLTALGASLPWRAGQVAVHFSGVHGLAPLAPVASAGGARARLHPLVSLPAVPNANAFAGCWWSVEADARARAVADWLVRRLDGQELHLEIRDDSERGRYHAAAVLASNAVLALVDGAGGILESLGADRTQATAALAHLALSSLRQVGPEGAGPALTGPIVRGDSGTVRAHLNALASMPELLALYRLLALQTLHLARASGRLSPAGAARIQAALLGEGAAVLHGAAG